MRNARVQELLAFCVKTVTQIKRQRLNLCIEQDAGHAALARFVEQCHEQRIADAFFTPDPHDCHAPDMSVGKQSTGADWNTIRNCHDVARLGIEFVPLHVGRHRLLANEYLFANCPQDFTIGAPVSRTDGDFR